MQIILGSQSPRRKELLAGLDIPFTTVAINCDESYPQNLRKGDIPLYICKQKAAAYHHRLSADDLLITADTIVWCRSEMLGKPASIDDARRMLRILSGSVHQVYTAVCLTTCLQQQSFVVRTDVTFKVLSDDEINYYVDNYRPLDKAGAYGIQEWIGYVGVERIEGSYFNVVGLPTEQLAERIKPLLHKK